MLVEDAKLKSLGTEAIHLFVRRETMGINKVSKLQFSPDKAFLPFLGGRALKLQGFSLFILLKVLTSNGLYLFYFTFFVINACLSYNNLRKGFLK